MKILYVTGMAGPLKDILSGKKENEITNSPGFFHPWFKLVKRGHQVDFVVVSNFDSKPDIKVDWFGEENIIANIYDPYSETPWYGRIIRRITRFIRLLYYTNKAITDNDYDFIYCKAYYEGVAGNIVANIRGIPCGMRSMGTSLYNDFEKHGVTITKLKRPAEYLTFKLKKEFFIMTDDGTKGDLVYKHWKPATKKYDYLFWKTGVDKTLISENESSIKLPEHDYIFFAGRVDTMKRYDRIIKILHELHFRNNHLHLYLSGSIQSQKYYTYIKKLVVDYGLENYVHYLGAIRQDELKLLAYHAIANPMMNDISNLGNVFFESFSVGSIIVGLNDGTLDEYLVDGENGFFVEDEIDACMVIKKLWKDKYLRKTVRENAISCANKKVLSIDERFDKEVDLIENVVASRKNRGFH